MDDDHSHWVSEQLDAAARNIHDTLTALSKDLNAHGRTDVYRAGAGDIFSTTEPDPRFFIEFTVAVDPPTLEEITKLLQDHIFWQAMAEQKPIDRSTSQNE